MIWKKKQPNQPEKYIKQIEEQAKQVEESIKQIAEQAKQVEEQTKQSEESIKQVEEQVKQIEERPKQKDVETDRANFLREVGESENATKAKDAAMAKMQDWMTEFYAVARIAMEDQPQLLEALGRPVKS